MKKYISKVLAFFMMGFLFLGMAQAAGDPVGMLNSIADQMISALKANKTTLKTNPTLVYSLARKIIVPHADLAEMSKRVLPPRTWDSATPAQRSQFEREFTTTLVRTYASALAEYKDQTIQFFPVRGGYQGKTSVNVDSKIVRSDGPSLAVRYSLVSRGAQWKLYDMTVEGVSMLESFRSQFSDQLSQGNIADVIKTLQQHNSGNN